MGGGIENEIEKRKSWRDKIVVHPGSTEPKTQEMDMFLMVR